MRLVYSGKGYVEILVLVYGKFLKGEDAGLEA